MQRLEVSGAVRPLLGVVRRQRFNVLNPLFLDFVRKQVKVYSYFQIS